MPRAHTPAHHRVAARPLILPADDQFVMPPEWAPHRATWIVWPRNRSDWPGKFGPVDWCYVELVRRLTVAEPVAIVFGTATDERRALGRLSRAGIDLRRVEPYRFPTNRSWIRDAGPTFVTRAGGQGVERDVAIVDWRFNAWAKYDDWSQDNRLPARIAGTLGLRRFSARSRRGRRIVFEGGCVDVNGQGAALTTEECLLDPVVQARNPGLGRGDMERVLQDHLGVDTVVWLGRGIAGDDTHGHVDDIARFVAPHTVVAATEPDPSDVNHAPLDENLTRLREARVSGERLTVVPIPMPRPLWFGTQRLPASYLNFYVANGLVLVPTFNDPADRVALSRLADLFPDREVVGIHAVDLVLGLGTLHCATLQEPAPG
jgi:agmatine deiminase